jgi:hypothetical protein
MAVWHLLALLGVYMGALGPVHAGVAARNDHDTGMGQLLGSVAKSLSQKEYKWNAGTDI